MNDATRNRNNNYYHAVTVTNLSDIPNNYTMHYIFLLITICFAIILQASSFAPPITSRAHMIYKTNTHLHESSANDKELEIAELEERLRQLKEDEPKSVQTIDPPTYDPEEDDEGSFDDESEER